MDGGDEKIRVNPGYALDQLDRALRSTGATAAKRVRQWQRVISGMLEGTLRHGSRTPVDEAPPWVTLEVAHGGFATGGFEAAGPLLPHEVQKLEAVHRPSGVTQRAALNTFYLGDEGRSELLGLLRSGRYRVTVPEEAALPAVAWLVDRDEAARAETVLDAISAFFDRLRFYPAPADRPVSTGDAVYVEPAPAVVEALRARRPNPAVEKMREAILVWTPLYDRAVELFLETVEGETPRLATDASGALVRRPDGNPIVEGGWPCRRFPEGWPDRARSLLSEYAEHRRLHTLSGKPEKPKENFARLRGYLDRAADDAEALSSRDVGMIRKILASYVTKHGAPGSDRLATTRTAQARNAARPSHHALGRVLADRIEARGTDEGLPDVDAAVTPLTAGEASELSSDEGFELPAALVEKAMRCLAAPVETLVARGIVTSSEGVANLLPHLTAQIRAGAIEDPDLRPLYAAVYRAFRRRRSLLLLDLERQVQLEELPWVAALGPWTGSDEDSRRTAREAMARALRLVLASFPQTILPNRLVRELRTLAAAAQVRIPLVDELAADIFMEEFAESFLRSAQAAAPIVRGTVYERYYGLPLDRVVALDDVERPRHGAPRSPGFAVLCKELAGDRPRAEWSVARNGTIIEQAQILTTHNLAPLLAGLELVDELRPGSPELARRCFDWIVGRLRLHIPNWQAEMQTVKNAGYAWRQMLFFLALSGADELPRFLGWADERLAQQDEAFRERFAPAVEGLRAIAAGREFDRNGFDRVGGGRRFLGWTLARHWVLPERRDALARLGPVL